MISLKSTWIPSDTAISYNSIGRVYHDTSEYEKALEMFLKALSVCKIIFGESHPITIEIYEDIGYIYQQLGNKEKAMEYLEK